MTLILTLLSASALSGFIAGVLVSERVHRAEFRREFPDLAPTPTPRGWFTLSR
jgi:hypothetical protein